jgi:lipopolysaccharide/colanic/teichoic acid biosynthesis glycosyltransferase
VQSREAEVAVYEAWDEGPRRTPSPLHTTGQLVGREAVAASAAAVPGSRHRSLYARVGKRCADLAVTVALLLVALPVLSIASAAVLVSLGRPVLFRQVRVGRDGQPFEVLKLRTMKPDRRHSSIRWGGPERRRTHKTRAHPLLTPLGRFLRTYSIDEVPQLLNVLKGEMSLVGPRPELPSVVAGYEPWQAARLAVRPGLTGIWQTTARGQTPMHECVEHDIAYLARMSLATDLRILAATPKAMLGEHRGY